MITGRARRILKFVKHNSEGRVESLANARTLIRQLGNLTGRERLFLECATLDRRTLRRFERTSRG